MTTRRTGRSALLYGACAVVLAAGAYLCFELGRYQAGYAVLDERRRNERYEQDLAEREATIETLRRRVAVLETSLEIDRETYSRVEGTLSQLQAQIQAQEEELAFYRGIVAPEDGVPGLRIQELQLDRAGAERRHRMRLVLVQAIVHSEPATGVVHVEVAGRLGGEAAAFDFGELVPEGQDATLAYDFRYFQRFERELVLPAGFEPERIEVHIDPAGSAGEPVTRRFDWSAVSGR